MDGLRVDLNETEGSYAKSRQRRPDRDGASPMTEHLGAPVPISTPVSTYVMHRAW